MTRKQENSNNDGSFHPGGLQRFVDDWRSPDHIDKPLKSSNDIIILPRVFHLSL